MRELYRKQHLWLVSVLSKSLREPVEVSVPEFPDWAVDEETLHDIWFDGEMNDEEEEEVVAETKRKRKAMKKNMKETKAEVKRGKRPVGADNELEEEEDVLAFDSDSESLSEGEKQENIEVMTQANKESEEEDPTSSTEEGEDFHDANDDLNAESDPAAPIPEPATEATPENPPIQVPQFELPTVNTDEVLQQLVLMMLQQWTKFSHQQEKQEPSILQRRER